LDEALKNLSQYKELALDTETSGLGLDSTILMLQLGTPDGDQYIFDIRKINVEPIKTLLEDPNILFIGHNIKFDYNVLKRLKILLNKVYDTMVVDQVIHNGKYSMIELMRMHRFSLNGVYFYYNGINIDKVGPRLY
jgi:ribonuclease D